MTEEFDGIEFHPPSPARVAARALALATIVCRGSLEPDAGNSDAHELHREILAWVATVGLDAEFEEQERTLVRAPLGSLSRPDAINASWRGEGMGVLAWALGRYDLPAYEALVQSPEVGAQLGFLNERASTVLAAPALRSTDELEDFGEKMFALHWRLREFSLSRNSLDFARVAREASFGPLDITGLPLVRGDLAIDGRALLDVGENRWRECLGIAGERHHAANWLAGYAILYSDVTADT